MFPIQIHPGSTIHSWPGRLWRRRAVQWLAHRLRALAARWRRRRAVNQLARLDDRTLSDIGISRSEIEFVTRYSRDGAALRRVSPTKRMRAGDGAFPTLATEALASVATSTNCRSV